MIVAVIYVNALLPVSCSSYPVEAILIATVSNQSLARPHSLGQWKLPRSSGAKPITWCKATESLCITINGATDKHLYYAICSGVL